jgi:RNA polymerase sigma-70 factor (sigma-E family)
MTLSAAGDAQPGAPGSGEALGVVQEPSQPLAIADLYATHRLSLVRLAVLLVDDTGTAEDVVHDAFVALQRNAARLRDPRAAVAYLQKSVVNTARSALRRRYTVRKHLRVAEPDIGEAADCGYLLAEEHREVYSAVRQLPPRDQQVLALRYWSELSEAEIAAALGISRGTVRSTASRALDKLEAILEAQR